jgi:hypothetical protein
MTALVKPVETEGILPKGSVTSFGKVVAEVRADTKSWVPDEPGVKFYE